MKHPANWFSIVSFIILIFSAPTSVAGFLGVEVTNYEKGGVYVANVLSDTPAALLGLPQGSVITHVDSSQISSSDQFVKLLGGLTAEKWYSYSYTYKNKSYIGTLVLAQDRKAIIEGRFTIPPIGLLGIQVETYSNDSLKGAKVTNLTAGKAAEQAGIQVGDMIVAIGFNEIHSSSDLARYVYPRPGETKKVKLIRNGTHLTKQVTIERKVLAKTNQYINKISKSNEKNSEQGNWCTRNPVLCGVGLVGAWMFLEAMKPKSESSDSPTEPESLEGNQCRDCGAGCAMGNLLCSYKHGQCCYD